MHTAPDHLRKATTQLAPVTIRSNSLLLIERDSQTRRAEIVLVSAEGVGTNEIMRQTQNSREGRSGETSIRAPETRQIGRLG